MSDHKLSSDRVVELLRGVRFPGFPRDIVTLGVVADVDVQGDTARISLRLPSPRTEVPRELVSAIDAVMPPGTRAEVQIAAASPAGTASAGAPQADAARGAQAHSHDQASHDHAGHDHAGHSHEGHTHAGPPDEAPSLAGVRAILAVSSAKGGVGKSTVATNLACGFAAAGLSVGLLDADVYGPSLPLMMDAQARPTAAGGRRFHPVERHGVRCMSMGFFLDESSPVIWRGPMVAGLVRQFLDDCVWGNLDVLVIDLPPGTGDAQLTLAQQVRLTGAVIVTTPQRVALRDVERGVAMFRKLGVPVLGVVENMSWFSCPHCGGEEHVFGEGGAGAEIAALADAPLLARLPIAVDVREAGDAGCPVVLAHPESESGQAFLALASRLAAALGVSSSDPAVVRA